MASVLISMKSIFWSSGTVAVLCVLLSGWMLLRNSQKVIDTSILKLGHAQINTGLALIGTNMHLMELSVDSYGRWFMSQDHHNLSTPTEILEAFNESFFMQTQTRLHTTGEILGWGPTFYLPPSAQNKSKIQTFFSSKDITANGTQVDYTYSYTLEDGTTSVVLKVDFEEGQPILRDVAYQVDQLSYLLSVQNEDDWWDQVLPWISADGSVYFYLTYQRRFEMSGIPFVMQSWEAIDRWHEYLLESVQGLGESHLAIIDGRHRLVSTTLLSHPYIQCSYTNEMANTYINCEPPSALSHSIPLVRDMAQTVLMLDSEQTMLTTTRTLEGRSYYVMVKEVIRKGNLTLWVVWAHAEEPLSHKVYHIQVLIICILCAAVALASSFVAMFSIIGFLNPLDRIVDGLNQIQSLEFAGNQIGRHGCHVTMEMQQLQQEFQGMWNAVGSFAKYVPKEVVRSLLVSNCGLAQLGMQNQPLTLLFMDIVGFTAICEKLDPETLSVLLTQFFSLTTHILLQYNATIDKFIGDAIMSFWGAPLPCQSAEHCACCAALEMYSMTMRTGLPELEEGKQPFDIRIGIHSGQALCGNIGGPQRMAFTAVGQTVNIAAAMEGLNKPLQTSILISHDVYQVVLQTFTCRYIGFARISAAVPQLMVYELHGINLLPPKTPVCQDTNGFTELQHVGCFTAQDFPLVESCLAVKHGLLRLGYGGFYCDPLMKFAIDNYSRGMHQMDGGQYATAILSFHQAHTMFAGLLDTSNFPISRLMAQTQAQAERRNGLLSETETILQQETNFANLSP